MGIEIERKFLVVDDPWRKVEPIHYCQGYLNRHENRTVRVRIAGDRAMLTVKSLTTNATRAEFEYDIPIEDAKELIQLCEKPLIEKYRRVIPFAGMNWEVDEFLGENQGLVVAEIELNSESQPFEKPDWVGEEVTDDPRYFNARLSIEPFSSWSQTGKTL